MMAAIVGVHGIGQQVKGEESLKQVWLPALQDGLRRAGARRLSEDDLMCAFYGDLFRKKGKKSSGQGGKLLGAVDVQDEFEVRLLKAWWEETARTEPDRIVPPTAPITKGRTPMPVQRALQILSKSRYWSGLAEHIMIASLQQVRLYLTEDKVRSLVLAEVADQVSDDTRVVIGHSLGSIVAYEVLCANPEWKVTTLVTLGSPLAIPNLIFDKLKPPPQGGVGEWPGSIRRWVNVADKGDVVALVKELNGPFGNQVIDERVDNGATAHDVAPYLTAEETGLAIAAGLSD